MEDKKMNRGGRVRTYARSSAGVAIGAGAALVAGYLVSRIKERQGTEATLSRLEQMIEGLSNGGQQ